MGRIFDFDEKLRYIFNFSIGLSIIYGILQQYLEKT